MISATSSLPSSGPHLFEDSSSFFNKKTIALVGCITFLGTLILIRCTNWATNRKKPDLRATMLQPYTGLGTYQNISMALEKANPQVSLVWGEIYITTPDHRGYCYLEEFSARVIVLDKDYFFKSSNKKVEALIGQRIVKKICNLYDAAYFKMDKLSFWKSCIYGVYFFNRLCHNYGSSLDFVTVDGLSPNEDLFKYVEEN